jgi:predicted DNA-binding protein YlxM (UPF0122 family)
MSEFDEFLKYNNLLDIYGKILSLKQREIASDYFRYNLSLSEISEDRKISRAAVSYSLEASKKKLEECEKDFGFLKKIGELKDLLKKKGLSEDDIAEAVKGFYKDGI